MAEKLSERLETLVRNAHPCWHAAGTIREAAELARRVEDAPVADIREDGTNEGESALLSAATRAGYYHGQRVRIVPDAGQGGVDHG